MKKRVAPAQEGTKVNTFSKQRGAQKASTQDFPAILNEAMSIFEKEVFIAPLFGGINKEFFPDTGRNFCIKNIYIGDNVSHEQTRGKRIVV